MSNLTEKEQKQLEKNASWWKDRMAQSQENISAKRRKEIEQQIKKYYKNAMDELLVGFENTYNKILLQESKGMQITPALLYQLDSYWQLQGQVKKRMQELGDKQIALLSKAFEEEFFEIYYSIALPTDKAFGTLSNEMVEQMINQIWAVDGLTWSARIWNNTERLVETLNEELLHCAVTGKRTSDLKRLLQERFSVSYTQADTLARTELAHIQTTAAQKRYKDSGITTVQLWADPDERRCKICGKLHKKLYNINEQMPVPVHPRCRCVMIPVVED